MTSDIDAQIAENIQKPLGEIPHPSQPAGTNLYGSTKIFPDLQAEDGESYFTLVHGIPHESSVSFVAILQATRALRKGFESAIYFYGPGTLACSATRGFPTTGDSGFPGEQNMNGSAPGGACTACARRTSSRAWSPRTPATCRTRSSTTPARAPSSTPPTTSERAAP